MILQGKVGAPTQTSSLSQGLQSDLRLGNMGDLIVSELNGRYYESTVRKQIFNGAITGVTTTVGLATTYTGLCLSNPIGSNVNIVLNKAGYGFLVAFPAASTIGLMVGFNGSTNVTHTTPVTPRNQFINGPSGVGLLDSAATLPTACTLNTIFGAGLTGAITTVPGVYNGVIDLEGSIILPPGGYVAFYTSTISGASGCAFSFQWQEIPII